MLNPNIILDVECIVCNKSLHKLNHNPHEVSEKMGKITNRRMRTPNWSVEEKQYLIELIRVRKDVVITKTNNGPHIFEEKDVAWNEILRELTDKFGNKFHDSTIKKVKTQWQNMKRIAREEITLNGPQLDKYSRQSYEVCSLLELIKDGVLQLSLTSPNENISVLNESNIEVKTERIDDDPDNLPLAVAYRVSYDHDQSAHQHQETPHPCGCPSKQAVEISESSSASLSEPSEAYDFEMGQEETQIQAKSTRNFSTNTDTFFLEPNFNTMMPRDVQHFFRYSNEEKQLKLEALKEERQVIRAMRETAELNKIIAEQRLKHVLWVKRQEMGMYSGEPGSGAGKGGGAGGAIREAGGAFGKMEAAREDEYFYRKQKEQIENMRSHLDKEITFHQEQIKRHEDAIRRHKETMANVDTKK